MANKNSQPPEDKKIILGRSGQIDRDAPKMAGISKINTNLPEIEWTSKKKALIITVLGFPYGFALVACFGTGAYIGGYILLGLLALSGLLVLALRLIDKAEF